MTMKETYLSMGIGEKTYEFCEKIEQDLKERFCEGAWCNAKKSCK